jgi:putative photosynthetic complex assembly protein
MQFRNEPAFRRRDDALIPRPMLIACGVMVAAALAFTTIHVATGRPPVGRPAPAPVIAERMLIVEGKGAQAVALKNPDGTLIADLAHGGFITVAQNALARARTVRGVDQSLPVRLVSYANGRLALEDPASGWSVELGAFGDKNKAVWAALLD